MTDKTTHSLLLVLCKGATGGRLAVNLESFLQFNAEIDQGLRQLEGRWSDFATVASQAAGRIRRPRG